MKKKRNDRRIRKLNRKYKTLESNFEILLDLCERASKILGKKSGESLVEAAQRAVEKIT